MPWTSSGRASSAPPSAVSPGGAWPRPRSTTSPARPASAGPRSTGSSPVAATPCSTPSWAPRSSGSSGRCPAGWRRPPRSRTSSSPASTSRGGASSGILRCSTCSPTSRRSCCRSWRSTASTASCGRSATSPPRTSASGSHPTTSCGPRIGSRVSSSPMSARPPPTSIWPTRRPSAAWSGRSSCPGSSRPPTESATEGGSHIMATSYEDMIGRSEINDLEAILSVSNTDVDAAVSAVGDNSDAIFTWDYEKGARPKLTRLYEKAKTAMWNGETDLPWDTDVDQEQVVLANAGGNINPESGVDLAGTPFAKWNEKDWLQFGIESQNWTLSQFMHGEQGALVCTAKIVETVPWIDAKYYASTQVMDEARHVEVFAKYLDTKLTGHYPINAHLKMLLDDIIG